MFRRKKRIMLIYMHDKGVNSLAVGAFFGGFPLRHGYIWKRRRTDECKD